MISSTFLTLTALAFPLHAFAVNIRPHQSYVRRAGAATDEILAGAPGTLTSPLLDCEPFIIFNALEPWVDGSL